MKCARCGLDHAPLVAKIADDPCVPALRAALVAERIEHQRKEALFDDVAWKVCRERDEARANACILVHAWRHDSRPPAGVVVAGEA